jgi:hypothetical protein
VLGEEAELAHLVVGAAAAGLAGLAVVGHPPPERVQAAAAVADRLGLFLTMLAPAAGVS